jgi:uroporphyrinogen-III decarboxylase
VDPIQDRITLEEARDLLAPRMTLVGGTNALSLASENQGRIRQEVEQAVAVLGPTNRFILHPVDAIFPDTPWEGVAAMIEAWKTCH